MLVKTYIRSNIAVAALLIQAIIFSLFFAANAQCGRRFSGDTTDEPSRSRREMRMQARESAAKAWFGVFVAANEKEPGGVVVQNVIKGSPADKAGVRQGDIIASINDTVIASPEQMSQIVSLLKPGTDCRVVAYRDGKKIELIVRIELMQGSVGRFSQDSPDSRISDVPAPRKGLLDINVLKYAIINPKTRVVTFIGKYDPAYNTGPIPYDEYLQVAMQNPYPSFSLDPSSGTLESLKKAKKIIDTEITRLNSDPAYADQWTQKAADLLLNDPSITVDRKRFFNHCARVMGITGDELKKMHDAATGKINIPNTEFMGLASKMIKVIGLSRAGGALEVLSIGGTPDELLDKMGERLGLTAKFQQLAMQGLSPEEYHRERYTLVMLELCKELGATEAELQSKLAAIRKGESPDILADLMGQKLTDYLANKLGRHMINGLVFGPEIVSRMFNLPLPKADLVFENLPGDSLLGDVFFKSDYRLKSVTTFPDALEKIPNHLTQHQYISQIASESMNKKLCGLSVLAGNRLVPGDVVLNVSQSGNVIEFSDAKIKILGWIIHAEGEYDNETIGFVRRVLNDYADRLTSLYDEYARIYPEWHKFSEAAKVIALARWARNNGYELKTRNSALTKINLPASVDGFWSAYFEVYENSQFLNFIAEGGASFSRDEGEAWLKAQQNVTLTDNVSKQLVASAVFAEQALEAAISGDLESSRALLEKSAMAMTGEIDLTRLPSIDGIPLPEDPATYAESTAAIIEEATNCFEQIRSASKEIEEAQKLASTSPEEAEKIISQSRKKQDEAQEKLNQILASVKNYKSNPSSSAIVIASLRGDNAGVSPNIGSNVSSTSSAGTQAPSASESTASSAKPRNWNAELAKIDKELKEVEKQILETKNALDRLNKMILSNKKMFEEWQNSASEGFERCVNMIADIAIDFGITGLVERYDTMYKLAQKLPGKPEDVIEKYRFTASLAQRLKESKAVKDVDDLANRKNETDAEIWETFRDGVNQLAGLFSLDDTIPGKWWKYGIYAVDTAYNLTEMHLMWKNIQTLEKSNESYAEAVKKLSEKLKYLVDKKKELDALKNEGESAKKAQEQK